MAHQGFENGPEEFAIEAPTNAIHLCTTDTQKYSKYAQTLVIIKITNRQCEWTRRETGYNDIRSKTTEKRVTAYKLI